MSKERVDPYPERGPVWAIARSKGKDYITPEDVNSAFDAGAKREEVFRDVLIAVELGAVEDDSCTAFVALRRGADPDR